MKILYFMNHVGQGGAALALYDLICELRNYEDVEVVVFTGKRNQLNNMLDLIGIENHTACYKNFMSTAHRPKIIWKLLYTIRHHMYLPLAILQIENKIDVKSFDIIHSNLNRIDIGAILAKKYRKPHVWHIREHAYGGFDLISIYRNFCQYMNCFQSTFVTISNAVKSTWLKYGIRENQMKLIYDGITESKVSAKRVNGDDSKLKIIFAGGYDPSKGQKMLVEAISFLPLDEKKRIVIDFYGNGLESYKSEVAALVKEKELQQCINVYGYDSNIYAKLCEYDIGVNCSKNEGFGRVTAEYMFSGLCPIVTNTGANGELVQDGETGYLFEYGNIKQLANIISDAIKDRKKINTIAKNATIYAQENFTMRNHAQKIYELYLTLMEENEVKVFENK